VNDDMELRKAIPGIWVYTTGDAFNASRGGYFDFLSNEQQARIERIRQARLLFDGRHREYFLDEDRTQFHFAEVRLANGQVVQLYLAYNVLGLISLKSADLLFGEEPILRADNDLQQAALSRLVERTNLHALLYGCAVDASYEAECFLEACVKGGEVYLRQIPADEIFPLGEIQADGQYARYARFRLRDVGLGTPGARPMWLLLESTYAAGSITHQVYQLDDVDKRTKRRVDLSAWSMPEGAAPLKPLVPTGMARNTITWVPNLLLRGRAVSDYDGAIDLQDALNAKNSQIGRVLLKHADPRLAMPSAARDAQGNVPQAAEVFFFNSKEEIPSYITWNADIENAMADRSFVLNQLLVRTETSPVLLGLKEGAAPDAYKKVRLESFNSLTKAARKAAYWRAGIRRAVGVAQDLEQTIPGTRYDRSANPIAVQLRDGIPSDTKDLAEELSLLKAARLLSTKRGLEILLHDPAAVEKEAAEIEAEAEAAMPTILMGGGAGGEPGESGPAIGAGDEGETAVAA
jgi:hypothetical protein